MRADKKMNKEVREMVEDINFILRTKKIKDESNDLFVWICSYLLLKKRMYHGFNYFRVAESYFNPLTGEVTSAPKHIEITTPDRCEFLQILIQ